VVGLGVFGEARWIRAERGDQLVELAFRRIDGPTPSALGGEPPGGERIASDLERCLVAHTCERLREPGEELGARDGVGLTVPAAHERALGPEPYEGVVPLS
jgi:hypothetical protein